MKEKSINRDILVKRAGLLSAVRSFFNEKGYTEIDAPCITPWPTMDSNIDSIPVTIKNLNKQTKKFFLHTSPEHSMKKLLASGSGDIYFLGKVYRDGEITDLHNPEFTMAEWYKTNADYFDIMDETEDLVNFCLNSLNLPLKIHYGHYEIDFEKPWERISVKKIFWNKGQIDLDKCMDISGIREAALKLSVHFNKHDDWDTIFSRIFIDNIEHELGFSRPCFVYDYPSKKPLMAAYKESDKNYVQRAELFIAGMELANGYTELTDYKELLKRFEHEKKLKPEDFPIDYDLIEALKSGMPQCSGIALGIDRLLMILLDKKNIKEVIPFPLENYF